LVCVGDDKGLSYYGNKSIMQKLSMNSRELENARSELIRNKLIAWQNPIYQVLCLKPNDTNRQTKSSAMQLGDIFKNAMEGAK
jgi:hypothetical protein